MAGPARQRPGTNTPGTVHDQPASVTPEPTRTVGEGAAPDLKDPVMREALGRHSESGAACPCADGPHPPLTPPAWRPPHGPDLLDVEDRRRLNEIAALKAGRRLIDLSIEGVAS